MGSSDSRLAISDLEEYEYCTFFTRKEILHLETRWQQVLQHDIQYKSDFDDDNQKEGWKYDDRYLPADVIVNMSELKFNPFKHQIVKVFSNQTDGSIGFDDFLDMMSVFSEKADKHVKASFAFKIYDWDGDGWLSREDLILTVKALGNDGDEEDDDDDHDKKDKQVPRSTTEAIETLAPGVIEEIVDKIIHECDLDGDKKLSFVEFDNIIARSPDFVNTFRIRI